MKERHREREREREKLVRVEWYAEALFEKGNSVPHYPGSFIFSGKKKEKGSRKRERERERTG